MGVCTLHLWQNSRGGSSASDNHPCVVQSCLVVVMVARRRAKETLYHQSSSAYFPPLLRDALLRATLYPLDSVLRPLPELFQQLHPARLVSRHWPWHARSTPQAFLVPTLPADAAGAGHHRRGEPLRPAHQFDRRALFGAGEAQSARAENFLVLPIIFG